MSRYLILSADHFHGEAAALAFIEARLWPHGPVCPRCGETVRVGRMGGKSTKLGQCKCYVCRKPFAVTIGTVMESSHIPLHIWLQAMHLLCASKKGISTHQLARVLGTTLKSAWFLSHRIREAMRESRNMLTPPLGGGGRAVEADESYVGPNQSNRAFRPVREKQIVMTLVERAGRVRSFHVPNVTANVLRPIVGAHVYRDSRFMSDESHIYTGIGHHFLSHQTVNHSAQEYVRGEAGTNRRRVLFDPQAENLWGLSAR